MKGMDAVARLLLERAEHAEAACRDRATADLGRLQHTLPEADRGFEPSRATSEHVYDLLSRIRYLEAVREGGFDACSGLTDGPAVALSTEDHEEFRQAVRDVMTDQRKFSQMLTSQVRRDGDAQ